MQGRPGPAARARAQLAGLCLLILCLAAGIPPSASGDDFYAGKTVRIVVGFTPGGGFDTYARALARHLPQHIPGRPAVVVENMPGAAGLIAANYAYRVARPDGLTIVNFHGNQILGQVLQREGVEFDARHFVWLGAPSGETVVCVVARRTGIASAKDWMLAGAPVKVGATSPGAATYDTPHVLQAALSLPMHLVRGYRGTAEIRLAVQSGEVGGFCAQWESVRSVWRDEIDAGEAAVVLQLGPRRLPDLPQVPLALELAHSEEARQLIRAGIMLPGTIARAWAMPPATPAALVRTLRLAYLETLKSPGVLADTARSKLEVDPIPAEHVERVVAELLSLQGTTVGRLRELLR